VVISIITLLISILLPALQSARNTAKRIACLSNLRQIGIACAAYEADEGRLPIHWAEYSPTGSIWNNRVSTHGTTANPVDARAVYEDYLSATHFLTCPVLGAPLDRSINTIPLGTQRVYIDYSLTFGYHFDFDGTTYDITKLWTRSDDTWTYDGKVFSVLAGDFFFQFGTQIRVNHPGNVGFERFTRQGTTGGFTDAYYRGNIGLDIRQNLETNHLFKDGSAQNLPGSDSRMTPILSRNLSANYLMPNGS